MELNQRHRYRRILVRAGFGVLLVIVLVVGLALTNTQQPGVQLPDGRIFQIEGVSFGTHHQIGWAPPGISYLPDGLSARIRRFLPTLKPRSEMHFCQPTLMVWANALDPITGNYVDCQQVRVEILDDEGDLYGGSSCLPTVGSAFWRVGHSFNVFPRTQRNLTLQITPWGTNQGARIQIPNPHPVPPVVWSGGALPQTKTVGSLEVSLTGLAVRTNGSRAHLSETPCPYWEPVWELRQSSHAALGWDAPDWSAEDPSGNRSRLLGIRQPVLRFDATFWPNATNIQETVLIGTSPSVALDSLQSNIWWNLEIPYQGQKVAVLGLFTPGIHTFSEGKYVPNTRGDAVQFQSFSHWEHGMTWSGSGKLLSSSSHIAPVPTIYLRAPESGPEVRLAVRVRDELGRCWSTTADVYDLVTEGAYLVRLPADVKRVVAEFVVLKPVHAEFFVRTSSGSGL